MATARMRNQPDAVYLNRRFFKASPAPTLPAPAEFLARSALGRRRLIDELHGVYDKLDADLRALIPLQRVWRLAAPDEI